MMVKEMDLDELSVSTLNLLLWMFDDSGLERLKQKSAKVLLSQFESIEAARRYRSDQEAQQFMLSSIEANR